MRMAVVGDEGNGGRRQRRTMEAADDDGMQETGFHPVWYSILLY